jgi:hypothetical protein
MFFRMNYSMYFITSLYTIRYSLTIYHCVVYNCLHLANWFESYIILSGIVDASFQEKMHVFCSHYVDDLNERDVFHATVIG